MNTQRTRIQNFVVELCESITYKVVSYENGLASVGGTSGGSPLTVTPDTILCNEIDAGFDVDTNMGRRVVRRKAQWSFEVKLAFPNEVSLEALEELFQDPATRLAADPANDFLEVSLELLSSSYEHPVQQQSAGGTKVTYIINAVVGRH